MNTADNIPEKHLLKTSRENYCKTVKIIKAVTKIDILFKNVFFLGNLMEASTAIFLSHLHVIKQKIR